MYKKDIKYIITYINIDNMKNSFKTLKIKIILLLFLLFVGTGAIAQPSLPGQGSDGSGQEDEAPISSLIAIGLIVGGYLGIKQTRK